MIGSYYTKKFNKGIYYWFDEAGSIQKYEDYDAPYEFSWEDVLKFMEKEQIKKEQIKEIHRSNSSGKYLWYIVFKPKEFLKTDNEKVFQLDGKTGNIYKTEVINTAKHLD